MWTVDLLTKPGRGSGRGSLRWTLPEEIADQLRLSVRTVEGRLQPWLRESSAPLGEINPTKPSQRTTICHPNT